MRHFTVKMFSLTTRNEACVTTQTSHNSYNRYGAFSCRGLMGLPFLIWYVMHNVESRIYTYVGWLMWRGWRSQLGCQKWWHKPPSATTSGWRAPFLISFRDTGANAKRAFITMVLLDRRRSVNGPQRSRLPSPSPYLLKVFLGSSVLQLWTFIPNTPGWKQKPEA